MNPPTGYKMLPRGNIGIVVMSHNFDYDTIRELHKGTPVEVSTPGSLEDTFNVTNMLTENDHYNVTFHIPARRVPKDFDLETKMRQLISGGVSGVLVVGGIREPVVEGQDPKDGYANALEYEDALSLLKHMNDLGLFKDGFEQIGMVTHPNGLLDFTKSDLVAVYENKGQFATYANSCLVLDPISTNNHIDELGGVGFKKPIMVATYGVVRKDYLLLPHREDEAITTYLNEGYFNVDKFLSGIEFDNPRLGISRVVLHTMSNEGDNVERTVELINRITRNP